MAFSTLAIQGEDKFVRQAYQRRKDDIHFFNMRMQQAAEDRRRNRILVRHLLDAGNTATDIAAMIGLSEEEMLELLPELA